MSRLLQIQRHTARQQPTASKLLTVSVATRWYQMTSVRHANVRDKQFKFYLLCYILQAVKMMVNKEGEQFMFVICHCERIDH